MLDERGDAGVGEVIRLGSKGGRRGAGSLAGREARAVSFTIAALSNAQDPGAAREAYTRA
jgi:hypothetical protein